MLYNQAVLFKRFWITDTQFGYKKLAAMGAVFFASWLLNRVFFHWTVAELTIYALSLLSVVTFIFALLIRGITIVRETVAEGTHQYYILDRFFPLEPNRSVREIYQPKLRCTYSSLYQKAGEKWSFFECIRKILVNNVPAEKSALVLGGGGAALPLELLTHFGIKSTVLEISPLMITLAKKYFFPLRKTFLRARSPSPIKLIQKDAVYHIKTKKKKYGLIIVDLFDGITPIPQVKEKTFVKNLGTKGDLILVNMGAFQLTQNIFQIFSAYTRHFRFARIYVCNKNFVGVFSNKKRLSGNYEMQRIY